MRITARWQVAVAMVDEWNDGDFHSSLPSRAIHFFPSHSVFILFGPSPRALCYIGKFHIIYFSELSEANCSKICSNVQLMPFWTSTLLHGPPPPIPIKQGVANFSLVFTDFLCSNEKFTRLILYTHKCVRVCVCWGENGSR